MCLSAVVDRMLLKYFMMQYSLETNFFFILLPHTPPQVGKKSSKFDTPLKKFLYNPDKFFAACMILGFNHQHCKNNHRTRPGLIFLRLNSSLSHIDKLSTSNVKKFISTTSVLLFFRFL